MSVLTPSIECVRCDVWPVHDSGMTEKLWSHVCETWGIDQLQHLALPIFSYPQIHAVVSSVDAYLYCVAVGLHQVCLMSLCHSCCSILKVSGPRSSHCARTTGLSGLSCGPTALLKVRCVMPFNIQSLSSCCRLTPRTLSTLCRLSSFVYSTTLMSRRFVSSKRFCSLFLLIHLDTYYNVI